MKKILIITMLVMTLTLNAGRLNAQIPGVTLISGVIKKVITALDLKVQRLQNEAIMLQNTEAGLENTMHLNSLTEISGWLNKERNLYRQYYRELATVKTIISDYDAVKRIIRQQMQLVGEYKSAYSNFQRDKHFSTGEIGQMLSIYNGLLQESVTNLDEALLAAGNFNMQMSDFERLQLVLHAGEGMQKNLDDLQQFNNSNIQLSLERAKDENDRSMVRQLYGIR